MFGIIKNGCWVEQRGDYNFAYVCSRCGKATTAIYEHANISYDGEEYENQNPYSERPSYCPWCGAKMRNRSREWYKRKSEKIKPCFDCGCGQHDIIHQSFPFSLRPYSIECRNCHAVYGKAMTVNGAISKWNCEQQ